MGRPARGRAWTGVDLGVESMAEAAAAGPTGRPRDRRGTGGPARAVVVVLGLLAAVAGVPACLRPGGAGDREGERMYRAEARALGSADRNRKYDAYARFYELGEAGIPTLLEALDSPNLEVRVRAARILVDFGETSGVPVLFEGLGSDREEIRRVAVQGLLVRAIRSREEIAGRLGDPDPRVRRGCLEVLRKGGGRGDLPSVVPLLSDADREVRREAVLAAGTLMSPSSIPLPLVDRLVDPDPQIRALARRVLLASGGYPGTLPPADDLERLRDTVDAIREWLAVEREIHSLDR